jgi:hypothetical protein
VGWTFLYLMLFLKLPILALLGIVWWAIRQSPENEHQPRGGGGVEDPHRSRPRDPRRPHSPLGPRGPRPRRDPHGAPPPAPPPRVRSTVARSRSLDR